MTNTVCFCAKWAAKWNASVVFPTPPLKFMTDTFLDILFGISHLGSCPRPARAVLGDFLSAPQFRKPFWGNTPPFSSSPGVGRLSRCALPLRTCGSRRSTVKIHSLKGLPWSSLHIGLETPAPPKQVGLRGYPQNGSPSAV